MTLWASRDERVLRHLVEHPPEQGNLETHYRSEQPRAGLPDLSEAEFYRAIEVLNDAGYVAWSGSVGEGGGGRSYFDLQVTGRARAGGLAVLPAHGPHRRCSAVAPSPSRRSRR